MIVKIPVSVGELADKITILEIKKNKINDSDKLALIKIELDLLFSILENKKILTKHVKLEISKLKKINLLLWDIEEVLVK